MNVVASTSEVDWLILGGGMHGVHIAVRLLGEAGVAHERVRIVDPGDQLLSRWFRCTAVTGMTHLRSTSVHHLDVHPGSLQGFAGKRRRRKKDLFAWPFERPSLELFNAHCLHVMNSFELDAVHIRDRALHCSVIGNSLRVALAGRQDIEAKNVVLALGAGDALARPTWTHKENSCIFHVFDPGFAGWPVEKEDVVVVGGGISAAQVALALHRQGHRVHLVSRHPLRQHQFDSDPGWLGPKLMVGFHRERCWSRRRKILREACHRGSVPPEICRSLHGALRRGGLSWHEGCVVGCDTHESGVVVRLDTGAVIDAHRILLATGFASKRPGGALVESLVESASLPCAGCGFPIVDSTLRWHKNIFVTGPLAELELGPASRNIAGARKAGERIMLAARVHRM